MRTFRVLGLFVALAFFVPACGSSPTDVPVPTDPTLTTGPDCQPVERDPQSTCTLGFLGSGG